MNKLDEAKAKSVSLGVVDNIRDELTLSVFKAIVHTGKLQDKKLQAALSNLDVNPAQYSCLFVICSNEGLNLRELAGKLRVENSTASVTVKRMEKAGFITRRADEEDCRMTRLYSTAYGKQQFEEAKEILGEYVSDCFGAFSDKELFTLIGLLSRLSGCLEQYKPAAGLL